MGQFNPHIRALVGTQRRKRDPRRHAHERRDDGDDVADRRIDQRTGRADQHRWMDVGRSRGVANRRASSSIFRAAAGAVAVAAAVVVAARGGDAPRHTRRARAGSWAKPKRTTISATAGTAKLDLLYESMRPLFHKEIPAIIAANGEQAIRDGDRLRREVEHSRRDLRAARRRRRCARCSRRRTFRSSSASIESAPASTRPYDEIYAQPGLLNEAGVKFAFSTGNGSNARHVPFHAQLAVAYGLPEDAAIKALTIWPAEIFGADKDIGSIATGQAGEPVHHDRRSARSADRRSRRSSSRDEKCRTTIGSTGCTRSTRRDR